MEGDKGGGGRAGVGQDDMGDGMQCSNHPCRTNPGGICAFCLQEKLGKLVSSSSSFFPLPIRGSSSSSSASFRSDTAAVAATSGNGVVGTTTSTSVSSFSLSVCPTSTINRNGDGNNSRDQEYYTGRARIPFLLAKKKKIMVASSDHHRAATDVFKRSKSTTTPRRGQFLDPSVDDGGEDFGGPRKRGGFWSFLYLSSKSYSTKKPDKIASIAAPSAAVTTEPPPPGAAPTGSVVNLKEKCLESSLFRKGSNIVVAEDDDSCNSQDASSASSFERKVLRSRSVGCGSRSFSGEFFERISTGFGDCTLRRVESHREGKPKVAASAASSSAVKERVKCGGLVGGFVLTFSSSLSSSSSSYWVSNTVEDIVNGKPKPGALVHGRNKRWGWAFASPMRAFNKPSSCSGKRDTVIRESNNKNSTPNLGAIPSLLAARVYGQQLGGSLDFS